MGGPPSGIRESLASIKQAAVRSLAALPVPGAASAMTTAALGALLIARCRFRGLGLLNWASALGRGLRGRALLPGKMVGALGLEPRKALAKGFTVPPHCR